MPGSGLQFDVCGVCSGDGSGCDVRGMRCNEATYSVRLSERPTVPMVVLVSVRPCGLPTLCDVALWRGGHADLFWQRQLFFAPDAVSWSTLQSVDVRAIDDEWDQHGQPYPVEIEHRLEVRASACACPFACKNPFASKSLPTVFESAPESNRPHQAADRDLAEESSQPPTVVTVSIVDDDIAAVKLWLAQPHLLAVSESGETARYGFSLETPPLRDVIVAIVADGPIVVSPPNLTYAAGLLSVGRVQYFTVSAADDDVANGARVGSVQHIWRSGDSHYNNIVATEWFSLDATIADDDVAGVQVRGSA